MLGDIVLIAACIVVLYGVTPFLSIPLILITYSTWKEQGGFIAWTECRQFMRNAKKIGI